VADFMGNLSIGAMAFDPTNPDIVYAGTGESFAGLAGIGMFKSTDGGLTWTFLSSTTTDTSQNPDGLDWGAVNRIAVNPANPKIVLAATSNANALSRGAVFRSTNGGTTWTRIALAGSTVPSVASPPAVYDIKFDPNDPTRALAGTGNGQMYYSTDSGASWAPTAALITQAVGRGTSARAEIAFSKSAPGNVYISLDNNANSDSSSARGQIWKSVDGGVTWTLKGEPQHLNTQGDYDNTIWVSPVDDSHVVTGGLDLYQSTDGGATFTRISTWQSAGAGLPQPHADHHVIVSSPDYSAANPVVYFGNDGGVYKSTNIFNANANGTSSWVNLNNNLGITQFYGGAGKRSAGGKIIGGAQDNGTMVFSSGTNWTRYAGGDGGFVAVDPVDDSTLYGEYVYASIHRTVNLSSRQYICAGITEGQPGATYCGANNPANPSANFISPFVLDPNVRDRMLVGAASLWMSSDVRTVSAPSWNVIKTAVSSTATSSHYINAIAVQEGNSNNIWVGYNSSGQVWKTSNGLAALPTWTQVNTGLPTGTINRIAIDKDNPNRVWVVYSGFAPNRVWQTLDGGNSWTSIHHNLPNVTMHDIKRHPTRSNWLYVGTANGVYTSEDGGATWSTTNDGPASVRVRELFWYDNATLVAATYGRGMFMASTGALPPQVPLSKRGGIDIDGDGKSEILVRSASAQLQAGRLVNNVFQFTPLTDPGSNFRLVGVGDFDGNGKSDLAFQNMAQDPTFGDVRTWPGFSASSEVFWRQVKKVWDVQAVGDLDGDGYSDLVWRYVVTDSPDTGVSYIWFSNGSSVTQVRKRGGAPLNWKLLGAADLNSDGAADMIYISPDNLIKALMATPNRTCANLNAGAVPSGYTALKLADFTGNGRGDILVRNATTGSTQLLSLNANGLVLPPYTGAPDDQNASCTASSLNVVNTSIALPQVDPGWQFYASGDFNGDGIIDIVWMQPSGILTVWLMNANGATPTVISNAGTAPGGYTVFQP
jgi:photosystem II stability/assembly factor-like uncharacterized protein